MPSPARRAVEPVPANPFVTPIAPAAFAPTEPTAGCTGQRRRPTPAQGRALEILGHAIEYLIDTQLHTGDFGAGAKDAAEASQVLMRLSREVFAECRVVVPAGERLKHRLRRLLNPSRPG
jgi:hypothetical protein